MLSAQPHDEQLEKLNRWGPRVLQCIFGVESTLRVPKWSCLPSEMFRIFRRPDVAVHFPPPVWPWFGVKQAKSRPNI